MKIVVNKDICFKTGQCYFLHRELIEEGIDNYPAPLVDQVPEDKLEEAMEMVRACPSGALSIQE